MNPLHRLCDENPAFGALFDRVSLLAQEADWDLLETKRICQEADLQGFWAQQALLMVRELLGDGFSFWKLLNPNHKPPFSVKTYAKLRRDLRRYVRQGCF